MSKPLELSNRKFGRLTVINRNGSDKNGQSLWTCLCDHDDPDVDPVELIVSGNKLMRGVTKSCGCLIGDNNRARMKAFKFEIGFVFGDLVVNRNFRKRNEKNNKNYKCCECICLKCGHVLIKPETDIPEHGKCYNCMKNAKWDIEDFKQKISNKFLNEYEINSSFINTKAPIVMRHTKCNYEWETTPDKFLRSTGCPDCARKRRFSYLHTMTLAYLEQLCSDTKSEHDIGFVGDKGGPSPYDVWYPPLNLLIEFQSGYHEGKEELDKRKKEYAINKGYNFITFDCRFDKPLDVLKYFDKSIKKIPANLDIKKYDKLDYSYIQKLIDNGLYIIDICKHTDIPKTTITSAINRGVINKPEHYVAKNGWRLRRGVSQYTLDGVIVRTYESASVASRENNINLSSIWRCCNNYGIVTVGGFIWRYCDEILTSDEIMNINKRKNKKPVVQYDLLMNQLRIFESITEAYLKTGVCAQSIGKACLRKIKTAGGYIWEYAS